MFNYFSFKLWLKKLYLHTNKMDDASIDAMIDNIEKLESAPGSSALQTCKGEAVPPNASGGAVAAVSVMRERLMSVVAGGDSKQYLGKNITIYEIENLDDKAILKLYARYDTYIGGEMTKLLKSALCSTYVNLAKMIFPKISQERLVLLDAESLTQRLTEHPATKQFLSLYTSPLYHNYGHFLAPLTVALLTSEHIHVKDKDWDSTTGLQTCKGESKSEVEEAPHKKVPEDSEQSLETKNNIMG
jgi:hypothetical protein